MMCYKDRSYCTWSNKCAAECPRSLTAEEESKAAELDLPIATADYWDTDECPGFVAIDGEPK